MKCPNCGLETNEKYCSACGAKMTATKTGKGKTLAVIVLSVAVAALVCTNVLTLVMFANKPETVKHNRQLLLQKQSQTHKVQHQQTKVTIKIIFSSPEKTAQLKQVLAQ